MDLPFGSEVPELDVLIVGAGLSGLTSGVKILSKEHSLNLKIIDENSSPGGLLSRNGTRFVNKEQKEMITFMSQINVTLRQHEEADGVQFNRCWDLDRGLTGLPAKFELQRYISMLDMRMKKFSSSRLTFRKRVPNMEQHICTNLFFSMSRDFMFNLVELVSGLSASDIKYDEFMSLCSSSGGLNTLIDIFFVKPKTLMDLSCKQLLDALCEKIGFTEIIKNTKAVKVKHYKDYVQVIDSHGIKYTAQAVILAIPWESVMELQFEPALPKQFINVSRNQPKAKNLITQYYMRYNKSYWLSQGYSGQFLNVKPLVVGFESQPTEYCGYMLHTPEQSGSVKQTVLDLLAAHFGEEMQDPLEYKEETNKLSTTVQKPQVKPWHRVIWSSSAAVATYNRNLMGGAVQSGIRAAINSLFLVRPQVVSWRDLLDVQNKNQYANVSVGYVSSLLSRLNLYNFTFYSVFVLGLIILLNFGYSYEL